MFNLTQTSYTPPVFIPFADVAGWVVGMTDRVVYVAHRPRPGIDCFEAEKAPPLPFATGETPASYSIPETIKSRTAVAGGKYMLETTVLAYSKETDAAGVPLLVVLAYAKEVILWLATVIPLIDGLLPILIKWWKMIFAPKDVKRAVRAYLRVKDDQGKAALVQWRPTYGHENLPGL